VLIPIQDGCIVQRKENQEQGANKYCKQRR